MTEVPPWGESPRKLATDLKSPGAEKKEKIEHEYRHILTTITKSFTAGIPGRIQTPRTIIAKYSQN